MENTHLDNIRHMSAQELTKFIIDDASKIYSQYTNSRQGFTEFLLSPAPMVADYSSKKYEYSYSSTPEKGEGNVRYCY